MLGPALMDSAFEGQVTSSDLIAKDEHRGWRRPVLVSACDVYFPGNCVNPLVYEGLFSGGTGTDMDHRDPVVVGLLTSTDRSRRDLMRAPRGHPGSYLAICSKHILDMECLLACLPALTPQNSETVTLPIEVQILFQTLQSLGDVHFRLHASAQVDEEWSSGRCSTCSSKHRRRVEHQGGQTSPAEDSKHTVAGRTVPRGTTFELS